MLTQEPVAIFGALAPPRLLGSETGLDTVLAQVLTTVGPSFKVITQQETAGLINRNDLANEYTRMRNEALQSHVLDRGALKKLGTAIGTRFAFQPKLIDFMQITKDRWELPPVALKVSRIRSSYMRLSLRNYGICRRESRFGPPWLRQASRVKRLAKTLSTSRIQHE